MVVPEVVAGWKTMFTKEEGAEKVEQCRFVMALARAES
jgi:hypothetical protein